MHESLYRELVSNLFRNVTICAMVHGGARYMSWIYIGPDQQVPGIQCWEANGCGGQARAETAARHEHEHGETEAKTWAMFSRTISTNSRACQSRWIVTTSWSEIGTSATAVADAMKTRIARDD